MFRNRGRRGSSVSHSSVGIVMTKVRNTEQLERTLDLRGIIGEKPIINAIMPTIMERLDEEERMRILATARRWQQGGGDSMLYNCMGEEIMDLDNEYDFYGYLNRKNGSKKLGKKLLKRLTSGKRSKKKEKDVVYSSYPEDDYWLNRDTMFTNGEWSDVEDGYSEPYKCIKFYGDIENELSVREFYSLKEFNDFCTSNGYNVSIVDRNNLFNWSIVHCCLDPVSMEYGEYDIITDNSYGALYWSVSENFDNSVRSSSDDVKVNV